MKGAKRAPCYLSTLLFKEEKEKCYEDKRRRGSDRQDRFLAEALVSDDRAYENIREPGTYYFHPTGALLRVPSEAINPGHSPVMNLCSNEQFYCTKISDDPWVPLNKARQICANSDFNVSF